MATKKNILKIDEILPSRNLEIIVRGLAISHFDKNSEQWKVFFPYAVRHPFRIIVNEIDTITKKPSARCNVIIPLASKIEIKNNNVSGGGSNSPTQYKELLDVSGLHGKIHLLKTETLYSGFLTVNQTTLATYTDPDTGTSVQKYDFWRVVPYPNPKAKELTTGSPKEIGKSGVFLSEFADQSITEINVLNLGIKIDLIHSRNKLYRIEFDNFCLDGNEKECDDTDFKLYYDVIDETQFTDKIRYELTPLPPTAGRGKVGSCDKVVASDLFIPTGLI